MISIRSLRSSLLRAALALILVVAAGNPAAVAQTAKPLVRDALLELELSVGGPVQATVSASTGLVSFLTFDPSRRPLVRLADSAPAADRALAFLGEYGAAFGVPGPQWVTPTRASAVDEVGMEHVRLRQVVQGVPVTGGELSVHLRGAEVVAVHAKTLSDLDHVATTPTVGPEAALEAVWFLLDRKLGRTEAKLSEPRLELFNRGLLESRRGWTRLAWFVEATATDLREYVWVDAESGAPLLHFSQLTDARNRQVHDAASSSTLPGPLARSEGDPPTGDADVDAAYDFSGDTYDYFRSEHGRDSYDDAGAALISTVDYCPSPASCPYANAFWNGIQMVYGAGFPAADDVDAHELTHAVNEHTANQFYYMQSGALNESFSDIFGETVDLTNGAGSDAPANRWFMGEDVPGFGAIRNMMDPTIFGDPGKVSDPQFVCQDPGPDGGGVHSNSGVPNHAYALMVDGGSYNGKNVTAIGLTKAGKIQYRALAHYLISSSDFLDNYNALIQACADLIGTAGITAGDCNEVEDALDAVEMSAPWPCSPAQAAVPQLCSRGQAPDLWHSWDVEASGLPICPSDTTFTSFCKNGPTSLLGAYATSGVYSYWGYNQPVISSYGVFIAPGGTLPANARFQFNHSHGFESGGSFFYDGAVVEYSIDGGATWSDGGPLISAGQSYAGVLSACCGNPLAGRSAFSGDSWGYTATRLDLSGQAGNPFRYRFVVGTDSTIDDYGWWIDDMRIYTCAACITNRVLDAAYNGLASFYGATGSVEAGSGFMIGAMEDVDIQAPEFRATNDFSVYGELTVINSGCR